MNDIDSFQDICEKVEWGERLSFEDGVRLYQSNDPAQRGQLAEMMSCCKIREIEYC